MFSLGKLRRNRRTSLFRASSRIRNCRIRSCCWAGRARLKTWFTGASGMRAGSTIGSGGAWRVLVIAPSVGLYPPAGKQASVFRTYFDQDGASYRGRASAEDAKARVVTWEEVAAVLATHAGYKEIADYLRWRLTLIDGKGNRRPGSPAPAK